MRIKKCPYCSGDANFGEYDAYDKFYYYVYCTSCGAHTKLFLEKNDALMVWNYREVNKK